MSQPDAQTPDAQAVAKARFQRLTVVRFAGVALAMVGAGVMAGKVDLPRLVGVLIFAMGLFYGLFFPTRLIRRWKAQDKGQK